MCHRVSRDSVPQDGEEGERARDMSKKGFRKLENHELTEFTTLHDEDSGSDSEMIEMERESVSKRGGG